MDYPNLVGAVLLAYLFGSFPFAWLICKAITGKDLRKLGSGNAGASNLRRVKGCEKYYFPAILLDAAKGVAAIILARHLDLPVHLQAMCGLCSELGHCYPVWLKFQGGKGVATLLGVAAALWWPFALIALLVFVILKKKSGYTSLASVVAVLIFVALYSVSVGSGAGIYLWLIFLLITGGHILNLNLIKLKYEPNAKRDRQHLHYAFLVHIPTDDLSYLKDYFVKKSQKFASLPNWFFNSILGPLLFLLFPAAFIRPATFWNKVPGSELKDRSGIFSRKPSYGLILPMPWGPSFLEHHQWLAFWAMSRLIRLAAMAGVSHVGLGAYTAIVCDKGRALRERFRDRVHITTGNEYTAWLGVGSIPLACEKMGKDIKTSKLLVIGTGGVGSVAALLVAELLPVAEIILFNRTESRAHQVAGEIRARFPGVLVGVAKTLDEAIAEADIIISATSSAKELKFDQSRLKKGAIVCDIARPRDFDVDRDDILVYDGGMVNCEGAELPSMLGLPSEPVPQSFGCLFQTQALAEAEETQCLGGVGGVYDLEEVRKIAAICNPRSDGIGALRNGDGGIITDEDIVKIKQAMAA